MEAIGAAFAGTYGHLRRCGRRQPFINAVCWILRTGAPWRDLPPEYCGWSNTHRRFIRWRDTGIGENLLEVLIDAPEYEWLMIDASQCKVHPHAQALEAAIWV